LVSKAVVILSQFACFCRDLFLGKGNSWISPALRSSAFNENLCPVMILSRALAHHLH